MEENFKKKNILIVGRSLGVGGIEKALSDFVDSIDRSKYDVSLFLFSGGSNIQSIDNSRTTLVNAVPLLKYITVTNSYAKKHIITFIIRSTILLLCKIFGSNNIYRMIFSFSKDIGPYDIAISYFHDQTLRGVYYGTNLYVLNKVVSNKKIAWIHSDYVGTKLYCSERNSLYKLFDAVVNVSLSMKKKFDSKQIISKERSFAVYNTINNEKILSRAKEFDIIHTKNFEIVTVARLDRLKSPLELCYVANNLRNLGTIFRWHIIGEGPLRSECEDFVSQHKLEDYVIFEGMCPNPYPYIANADLLVSGSISESFGLSIYEALLLGTPVVSLYFDAINELIDGSNGIVVNTFDEMTECIKNLASFSQNYQQLRERTHLLLDYNEIGKEQFEEMLNKLQ